MLIKVNNSPCLFQHMPINPASRSMSHSPSFPPLLPQICAKYTTKEKALHVREVAMVVIILLSFIVLLVSKYLHFPSPLKEKLQYLLRDCKALFTTHYSCTQFMYTFLYTKAIEELNCLLLHTKTHDQKHK